MTSPPTPSPLRWRGAVCVALIPDLGGRWPSGPRVRYYPIRPGDGADRGAGSSGATTARDVRGERALGPG